MLVLDKEVDACNEEEDVTTAGLPNGMVDAQAALRNKVNRHVPCRANYCLRLDKNGCRFCRFHFPQKAAVHNITHFYCKRVKGGIRWYIYLPLNDTLMNSVNPEQSASQRANTDFKPLIDHFSSLEYSTKSANYASKAEKGSKAFEKTIADAFERTRHLPDDSDAKAAFSSYLIQQVGGRNWSAQEVAHVNNGLPTVISSHNFYDISLATHARVRSDLNAMVDDDAPATETGAWTKYLRRAESLLRTNDPAQATIPQQLGDANSIASSEERLIMACSLTEFYRLYEFKTCGSGQKGKNQIVRREKPTIVRVKPRLPTRCGDAQGSDIRKTYCRVKLQSHMCFGSEAAYRKYIHTDHHGDYEAAYEHFATTDPDAPDCCKDDFRSTDGIFEDEGDEVRCADPIVGSPNRAVHARPL